MNFLDRKSEDIHENEYDQDDYVKAGLGLGVHQLLTKEEYSVLIKPNNILAFVHILLLAFSFILAFMFYRISPIVYTVLLIFSLQYTQHLSHDCWHNIFFSNKKLNTVVGRFLSGVLGYPYNYFKRIHFNHHRFLGQNQDPSFEWTNSRLSEKSIFFKSY